MTVRLSRIVLGILLGTALLLGSAGHLLALEVGDQAPNFVLPSTTGKSIELADYQGKKDVVLFFYIGAFTKL
jgi:hypothetical protein